MSQPSSDLLSSGVHFNILPTLAVHGLSISALHLNAVFYLSVFLSNAFIHGLHQLKQRNSANSWKQFTMAKAVFHLHPLLPAMKHHANRLRLVKCSIGETEICLNKLLN